MATAAPLTIGWDISSTTQPGAFDQYRASFDGLIEVDDVMDAYGSPFRSQNQTTIFASGFVSRARSSAQTLRRPAPLVRRADLDAVCLILVRSDATGEADGRSVAVGDRGLLLQDYSRPGLLHWEDLDLVLCMRPRNRIPAGLLGGDLHGRVLGSDQAVARLVGDQLESLSYHAPSMDPEAAELALDAIFLLLDRGACGRGALEPEHRGALYKGVRHRALAYIRDNLAAPELSVASVARACAVSRATLFRAFDGEGGVQHCIQGMRLDQARRALAERASSGRSIAEVAYAHGFPCPAYFSRAFRARFGYPPSDVQLIIDPASASGPAGAIKHHYLMDRLRAAS